MAIPSVTLRDRLEMFENAKRGTDKIIREQRARIAELEAERDRLGREVEELHAARHPPIEVLKPREPHPAFVVLWTAILADQRFQPAE